MFVIPEKYRLLFALAWQQGLAYRASIFLWRLRQFLSAVMSLAVWQVIYRNQDTAFGYSQDQMFGYIFVTTLLQNIILTTGLYTLANDIYSGRLSNLLLKPVSLLAYFVTQDAADKLKNIGFTVVEMVLLYLMFRPELALPSAGLWLPFATSVVGGLVLLFLMQLVFGAIGFWSPDTWGPRFLFFMLIDISSGKLFPLDVFPRAVQWLFYLTPFPYFTFIQAQVYLGRLSPVEVAQNLLVLGVWIALLLFVTAKIWQKGLREYQSAGQ